MVVCIELPHAKTGLVVGKGGNTLRELQEKTNAKLKVANWSGVSDKESRLVQLRGTASQINLVKALISEKTGIPVDQMPNKPDQPSIFSSTPSLSVSNKPFQQVMKVLLVPSEHVGLVIGKGGETLKSMKNSSGASISVQKEAIPGTNNRPITLQGQPQEVEAAMMLIMSKVRMMLLFFLFNFLLCRNFMDRAAGVCVIFSL